MKKLLMTIGWCVFIGLLLGIYVWITPDKKDVDGPVNVVFMNTVEDADVALLYQKGAAVMIDTGTEADVEHILSILKENEIEHLDYLILSHGDKDHIGGALRILDEISVTCVIESGYEEPDENMLALNDKIKEMGISLLYPVHTQRLAAGDMHLLIYPPLERNYQDDNNYSLAVMVQHGSVDMMFAGDALKKRSQELLLVDWPEMELYKIPHHARGNVMSGELFDRMAPEFAVATSDSADSQITEAAIRNGTQLFYTGKTDVLFESDGEHLIIKEY